ncbi:MAG: ABC transporter ATP-binding protein [Bacteroidales bacterium]|nr:ABC transporter ATP-binding protein [Bacteroidales bacterium]
MKAFIRFAIRFISPYKWQVFGSVIFNFLSTLFTVFSFAFIMPILNVLFSIETQHYDYMEVSAGNLNTALVNNFYWYIGSIMEQHGVTTALGLLCAALVIMTFIKVMTYYASDCFIIPVQNGLERDIRNSLYERIISLPIGFFTLERKGDIIARSTADVKELQVSVVTSISSLIRYPIAIIISLSVMLYLSWRLTAFVFVILPFFGWIMGMVGKKLKSHSFDSQTMGGELLSNIEETIGGLRVVKAFNAQGQMDRRFRAQTQDYYKLNNHLLRMISLAHPMSEFIGTIAVAVILWFGGSLILGGHGFIDASMFIFYLLMFYNLINPSKELTKAGYTIQKGMAAMDRIDRILGAENPIKQPENPAPVPDPKNADIRLEDVNFSYDGHTPVLRDINLHIAPGQTVALVGQSGSGKSTLVDLIPRFWDVDSGRISVGGTDIRDLLTSDLRGLMGNVNQEALLFNDTIFNNIAFGMPDATQEEVEQAARIANAHEFIINTEEGYQTRIGDRGCRLSGGQRQRISIARAVLKDPSILILDEATSALDTESERLVQEALDALMRDRTTIVVAHRLSTIINADLICVLQNGRIVERGTHDELIALNGMYKKLVDMQQV